MRSSCSSVTAIAGPSAEAGSVFFSSFASSRVEGLSSSPATATGLSGSGLVPFFSGGSAFASIDLRPRSRDVRGEDFAFGLDGSCAVVLAARALSVEVRFGASTLCLGLAPGDEAVMEAVSDFRPACFAATARASRSWSRSFVLFRVVGVSGLAGAIGTESCQRSVSARTRARSWSLGATEGRAAGLVRTRRVAR